MKRLLLLTVLLIASVFAASGCTPVDTAEERNRRIARICDIQMRMLVDDFDYLILFERESRLSQWTTRIGY